MREAVAIGVINLAYLRPKHNYTDLLTKALILSKHYAMCKPFMYTKVIEIKARGEVVTTRHAIRHGKAEGT